jgi:hypothetical protein
MRTHAASERTSNGGVGGAAKQVAESASSIARLEVELATLELKKKVSVLGIGIGLGAGAALLAVFMVGFLFLAIAAGFDTFLPTWLALLIVTAILLLLAALLGFLAKRQFENATPPLPEQAIREAKLTQEALKH